MTIRVYPSRLEGEPIEVHETSKVMSIAEWFSFIAPEFRMEAEDCHPTVTLNGEVIPVSDWPLTYFKPADRLDVHIEARGSVFVAVIAVVLAVVAVAMAKNMKAPSTANQRRGTSIEDPGELANQVRWGDPIPEIAGSPISFPDYILPPRSYYVDKRQQWVESLVCVGVGKFQIDPSQVWIGETSLPTLGSAAELQIFQPGDTIPSPYSDWWYSPEEVGFTSFGGAGMTLGVETSVDALWTDSISFQGQSIIGNVAPPESWVNGINLRVEAEHTLKFDSNSIQSSMLDTLQISANDEIELTGTHSGVYTVSSVIPGSGGTSGTPATVTGDSAPSRYDFDVTPASLTITLNGAPLTVSLTTAQAGLSSLIGAINTQLNGTQVRVRSEAGALEFYQIQPYTGGMFAVSGDVSDLLGSPIYVSGSAATPGSGTQYVVAGANFGAGSEVASAGRAGLLYTITGISGNEVSVVPPGVSFWSGFPAGISNSTSAVQLDSGSVGGGWIGWFTAVPRGEKATEIEVDIFLPQGLIHYNKKGRVQGIPASGVIQWRYLGSSELNSIPFNYHDATPDQMGFTHRIVLPEPGRVEVRVRRNPKLGWNSTSEELQWSGLRAKLIGAPDKYPGLTLLHLRLRSGDKISAGVENKLSLRALRILPTVEDPNVEEPTRDIVPFFIHMMNSVGYGREFLDMPHLEALHETWVERGDHFDLAVNGDSTLKTVANYCLNAGFAELTVRQGKISAFRDVIRYSLPDRIYGAQELRAGGELVEHSTSVMPDDIDGVDAEYVDYLTGRTMTVEYRMFGDKGLRVQKIKVPGVSSKTVAWRLAARRRRIAAYRRTTFKGGTELAAMNSFYGDFIGLQDGIPEWGQSAFVLAADGLKLTLSEPVRDLVLPIAVRLRRPDGTATEAVGAAEANGRTLVLSKLPDDFVVSDNPNNPTVVYLGKVNQVIHRALMMEVRPRGNGQVDFEAVNYDERVYAEDDSGPNRVILTSHKYRSLIQTSHQYRSLTRTSKPYPLMDKGILSMKVGHSSGEMRLGLKRVDVLDQADLGVGFLEGELRLPLVVLDPIIDETVTDLIGVDLVEGELRLPLVVLDPIIDEAITDLIGVDLVEGELRKGLINYEDLDETTVDLAGVDFVEGDLS